MKRVEPRNIKSEIIFRSQYFTFSTELKSIFIQQLYLLL